MSDPQFAHLRRLIHRESGIHLRPAQKVMLVGRLGPRLRELGLRSFGAYCRYLGGDHAGELDRMLDCVCTNETSFFRSPHHFELLRERLFPAWCSQAQAGLRPRSIRAWSAGCSTGEEPFSLAMCLADHFAGTPDWRLGIEATDLSNRALRTARAAVWPASQAVEIAPRYLRRFMLRGTARQAGKMKATPELRALIRFRRLNLARDAEAMKGPFDLIFCRNVLIYFDTKTRRRVIGSLLERLSPEGLLFLGPSESLMGVGHRTRAVAPAVYALAGVAPWRAPASAQRSRRAAGRGGEGGR
ncbi:MAG: protein-glutamate O-methyltransferase CheR [Myxococcota bacterium]|nr:protein-glutamate O-methyltransferase CheR [Myxococcota bacterium]